MENNSAVPEHIEEPEFYPVYFDDEDEEQDPDDFEATGGGL